MISSFLELCFDFNSRLNPTQPDVALSADFYPTLTHTLTDLPFNFMPMQGTLGRYSLDRGSFGTYAFVKRAFAEPFSTPSFIHQQYHRNYV